LPVREQVPLSGYTTLRLGGPAARFVEADTDAEIIAALRAADDTGEPVLVLGGGSNLVVPDEGFPGTVIRVLTRGVRITADDDAALVTVAAGQDWDSLVARCAGDRLAGVECLSGIPGLAGATPIQNVGAYGQEVAETIVAVSAYDRARGVMVEMANADCGFGYRSSAFKREAMASASASASGSVPASPSAPVPARSATGRFVVLSVTFRLARDPLSSPLRYAELARSLGADPGARLPLGDVRAAVLRLRRRKGMVLDPADPDTRSAGSFFTNPVLDPGQLAALEQAVEAVCGPGAQIPRYGAPAGQVKVSAAWLIEHAGFVKGYPARGNGSAAQPGQEDLGPRISTKHTLALVNPGGSSTKELLDLATEITNGVRETFGVELVTEPVLVAAG
jgi:UDP-N-acetylenolpyruvoylglucosamine reductase